MHSVQAGGGQTCRASTSCRQSSPTLKMQAMTFSCGAWLPSSVCSVLKATRMGTWRPRDGCSRHLRQYILNTKQRFHCFNWAMLLSVRV